MSEVGEPALKQTSVPVVKKKILVKKSKVVGINNNKRISSSPMKLALSSRVATTRNIIRKSITKSQSKSPTKSPTKSPLKNSFKSKAKTSLKLSKMPEKSFSKSVKSNTNREQMFSTNNRSFEFGTPGHMDKMHKTTVDFKDNDRSFAYKNYGLSTTHHMVKHPKKLSESFQGHFEIVPNTMNSSDLHVPSIEFSKICDRNLVKAHRHNMSLIGKRNADQLLPADIPNIMKKHVPGFAMKKITFRQELFDIS